MVLEGSSPLDTSAPWPKSRRDNRNSGAFTSVCENAGTAATPEVIQEWRFDLDGQLLGWSTGGHIRDTRVQHGALRGTSVDWDPILLGPVFEIKTSPTQFLEVRMRCQRTGMVEVFWTETLMGKYGGFNQEKYTSFSAVGGDDFCDYRVYPFWHAKKKVIRLRLDMPPDGEFAVQSVRILDTANPSTTLLTAWSTPEMLSHWQSMQQTGPIERLANQLQFQTAGNRPILLSPMLKIDNKKRSIVAVRMAVSAGSLGRVYAVNRTEVGWEDLTFSLKPDGRMHTYNIDMGGLRRWQGNVVLVGLQPTDTPGARVAIESIELADDIRGPADLEIDYFGKAEGVNRVGKPARIICTVRNSGGELAHNVTARLEVPEGVEVLGPVLQSFEPVSLYLPRSVDWHVRASRPGRFPVTVRIGVLGQDISAQTTIDYTNVPKVEQTGYVPAPQPVRGHIDVGAFYFPGWQSTARWAPILDFPRRRPVLGWYDEANPECADWQIKWAVEHGVSFFMVDWYWSKGNRQLEHWLHDAYANARYKSHLKWAIMWANHSQPGSHSLDDWRQVTQYWINHYLKKEEYHCIDGRPAVFIWSPQNIRVDLGGSEKVKQLYALSQQMARDAGLPGIYFVAMSSHSNAGNCRELKAEGFEAFTSYHGFQLAEHELGTTYFSFEDVVRTSPQVWKDCDERSSGLEYFPIIDTGWSSEPWHRRSARVIHGRTPERFGRLCQAACGYAEEKGKTIICLGPWNEWGEGSYIEPYAEYGFGDLDALREAFCPLGEYPPNIIPSDVGLGRYDLEFVGHKTSWEFDSEGNLDGWTPNGALHVEVTDGVLKGRTTGPDPILNGPSVRIDTKQIHNLAIRMRSTRATQAQLYWGTTMLRPSEMTTVRFQVPGDNRWHEYRFDLREYQAWRGVVASLRFDPAMHMDTNFAVAYLRLE